MALIKCTECGKEISDQAVACPECGFLIKKEKRKKSGRKVVLIAIAVIVAILVVLGAIVLIQGNTKKQEKISYINKAIEEVEKGKLPSKAEFNNLLSEYDSLTDNAKEKISNWKVISNLNDIDLDKVHNISEKISKIKKSSSFKELVELKDEIDALDDNTKKYIDSSKLDQAMELTDIEQAALAACKNIKSVMINQDSFEVQEITVKNDLDKMNFYWVLVEYSGTNSFGGTLDKTSCFGITSDFEDPFFGMAQIAGYTDYLDSTTSYNEYTKCTKKEEIVDSDKITYYLNN